MKTFQIIIDAELRPILPRYMEIQYSELELMEEALEKKDCPAIRMLGHKLKGSGSSFGFTLLTVLGEAIEQAGKDEDLASARDQVARVRDYLQHVHVNFSDEV